MTIRNCPNCGGTHFGSIKCPYINEPCSVCGDPTILACSDCAIDSGGKKSVHVCSKTECRDQHEREKHPTMHVDKFLASDGLSGDMKLMQRNLALIEAGDRRALRVSAEHYAWLSKDRIAVRRDHEDELKRLWHFAGCPFEHCQTCIDDAEWIKSLHKRLGPPSAECVMAQRNETDN